MALMHEIKEDFILSNKELAEKYYEEMMKNVPVQGFYFELKYINLVST
jgi:hypothetical protein